ncbi:hypothetical protein [Ekhidna sp.]|uniref:hypothetical protein n=1 Tax=Ekhidna sp. TaxID=2608089 RepID=UPI003CCC3A8A
MKKRSIVLLGILAIVLNSCVYSLFPIYTEDTIVFKEELLGRWSLQGDKAENYIDFRRIDEESEEEKEDNSKYVYSIEIQDGFTMSSNEPLFIMEDGKKIYNEDSIKLIMKRRLTQVREKNEGDEMTSETSKSNKPEKDNSNSIKEFTGTISVYEEKGYRMTVMEDGKAFEYTAHLARIGEDIFLDIYPETEFSSNLLTNNYFPVHTFFKLAVENNKLTITSFDLEKLNKLFESNLIRIRHENVEGSVLITAQPEEMQKFFDKYADDENVFDEPNTYNRVVL